MPIIAAIDFGSANSGIVYGDKEQAKTGQMFFANQELGRGYSKTSSAMLVKRSLLEKVHRISQDNELSIFHPENNASADDFNIVLGDQAKTMYYSPEIIAQRQRDNNAWVYFENFKMNLYLAQSSNPQVKGSDGKEYDLVDIISLYLRGMKKLSYQQMDRVFGHHNVSCWGVTIPTIWDDRQKKIMTEAVKKAGMIQHCQYSFILEPEGAAVSYVKQTNGLTMKNGETILVIDCGGGTTDIVAQKITDAQCFKSEEITQAHGRAVAGAQIDELFWKFIAQKIGGTSNPYDDIILRFRKEKPALWPKLESVWEKIKCNPLMDRVNFPVDEVKGFYRFLEKNFPGAVNKLGGDPDLGINLIIRKNEIEENVYSPVAKQILSETQKVIDKCGKSIDYIYFAGGLSGIAYLQSFFESTLKKLQAKFCCEANLGATKVPPGSSIMRGALFCLADDRIKIQRRSKRNYYVVFHPQVEMQNDCIRNLVLDKYKDNGFSQVIDSQFKQELDIEIQNRINFNELDVSNILKESHIGIYTPVCLRGQLAEKYEATGVHTLDKTSETLSVYLYSSEQTCFLPYRTKNDERVDILTSKDFNIKAGQSFSYIIDFNEFQQTSLKLQIFQEDGDKRKFFAELPFEVELE